MNETPVASNISIFSCYISFLTKVGTISEF